MVRTSIAASQRELKSDSIIWRPWCLLANDRRSGKPSSMAWNQAEEMAASLSSRESEGVPIETVANEVGIEFNDERVIAAGIFEIDVINGVEETAPSVICAVGDDVYGLG
jgi:hypothetical protein